MEGGSLNPPWIGEIIRPPIGSSMQRPAADGVMILGTKEKASASGAHTPYRGIVARRHSMEEFPSRFRPVPE